MLPPTPFLQALCLSHPHLAPHAVTGSREKYFSGTQEYAEPHLVTLPLIPLSPITHRAGAALNLCYHSDTCGTCTTNGGKCELP
ncbi:hypothetical protein E2C01_006909 [Portunus trituberculatus]|uniref:Uncharacterized protein n=1 Tax=Portunus trituberculatus TaxID=210409 RepID=A0A5B7CWP0_PORTR|nr:hypothetical protein [Portunus trituberculatus]